MGVHDPDLLLASMSYTCYLNWTRFYVQDPFGEQRADLRAALVAKCCVAPWSRTDTPLYDLLLFPQSSTGDDVTADELLEHIEKRRAEEKARRESGNPS